MRKNRISVLSLSALFLCFTFFLCVGTPVTSAEAAPSCREIHRHINPLLISRTYIDRLTERLQEVMAQYIGTLVNKGIEHPLLGSTSSSLNHLHSRSSLRGQSLHIAAVETRLRKHRLSDDSVLKTGLFFPLGGVLVPDKEARERILKDFGAMGFNSDDLREIREMLSLFQYLKSSILDSSLQPFAKDTVSPSSSDRDGYVDFVASLVSEASGISLARSTVLVIVDFRNQISDFIADTATRQSIHSEALRDLRSRLDILNRLLLKLRSQISADPSLNPYILEISDLSKDIDKLFFKVEARKPDHNTALFDTEESDPPPKKPGKPH